jgi:hypothetical protein
MRRRTLAAAMVSFVLSLPFAVVADARADHALHGWRSAVVAPGYTLAMVVDENFPEHGDLHNLLPGLGRFMLISLSINCLLYGILLFPTMRFIVVPKLAARWQLPTIS